MTRAAATFALLGALLGSACSATVAPAEDGGASSDAAKTAVDLPEAAADAAAVAVLPVAPTLKTLMKMSGGLHVMWTNPSSKCDSIEGERKADMADGSSMEKYKVVFTVPGEADNKHETTATADMKYTYRLRCKVGTQYSEYSNEKSGNPKQ